MPEVAWSPVARLGLGSALRRLADEGLPCVLVTRSGVRHDVVLLRIGRDFVEAEADGDRPRRMVLATAAIGVVQSRDVG